MAKKGARVTIYLACTECESKPRNYTSQKNKNNDKERLELKKYCSRCRRHTTHRETK